MFALCVLILVLSFAPVVVAVLHISVGMTLRADGLLARLDTVRLLTRPKDKSNVRESNLYNQVLEALYHVMKFASTLKLEEIQGMQEAMGDTAAPDKAVIDFLLRFKRDGRWSRWTFFTYSKYIVPSLVLSLIYAFGFLAILPQFWTIKNPTLLWCYGELYDQLNNAAFKAPHLYLIYTFVGSYVYNSGVMLRRVFTWDVSGQMFWWAIYHVTLSIGLAAVVKATTRGIDDHLYFLFAMASASILDALTRELRAKLFQAAVVPSASESSLQLVSGIDYWKAQRLMEEGIEGIQHLATADFIALALYTRSPLPTVIDWVDQAIFIHRFPGVERKMLDAGLPISAVRLTWAWQRRMTTPSFERTSLSFETYLERLREATGVKDEVLVRTLESWEVDNQVQFLSLFCEVGLGRKRGISSREEYVASQQDEAAALTEVSR